MQHKARGDSRGRESVRLQRQRSFAWRAEAQLVSMKTIPEAAEYWEEEQLGLRNAQLPALTRGHGHCVHPAASGPWQGLLGVLNCSK